MICVDVNNHSLTQAPYPTPPSRLRAAVAQDRIRSLEGQIEARKTADAARQEEAKRITEMLQQEKSDRAADNEKYVVLRWIAALLLLALCLKSDRAVDNEKYGVLRWIAVLVLFSLCLKTKRRAHIEQHCVLLSLSS